MLVSGVQTQKAKEDAQNLIHEMTEKARSEAENEFNQSIAKAEEENKVFLEKKSEKINQLAEDIVKLITTPEYARE